MYLTREEAVEKLVSAGSKPENANALLDHALRIYPRSNRTNFLMITGYRAGTHNAPFAGDLFTVNSW